MGPRLMILAGGTGGHVFPALAVAHLARDRGWSVSWLGTRAGLEARIVPQQGYPLDVMTVSGLRGKHVSELLAAPPRLARALWQAGRILRRRRPDVVLGMGGFVAGPAAVMAVLHRVPLVIHEQNRVPGLTNRWLARIADQVFEAFPESFPTARRARVCGNPVRADIVALPPPARRFAGRSGPPRLLVLGGSLGAKALNEAVPAALARMPISERPEVRHQCGDRTIDLARRTYEVVGVKADLVSFIDDMAQAYDWADLVIGRAGALTVSELAAAGVGAILVPYPFAVDDHQAANAQFLAAVGAARMVRQHDLTVAGLAELLTLLLADRQALLTMAEAARARAEPNAAQQILDACGEVTKR